jgi:tetratricopeptide (TPR) repeat protein
MGTRLAKKVLGIGWDAADWKVADPLMARGRMPNLKRLVENGVRGSIRTLEPRLSPLLWTSVATGKRADKHGILNFVEAEPTGGGIRPSTSTSRKTKALWNILSQSGLRTNVVSWYASHPSEPIRGVGISNMWCEGMPQSAREAWALPAGSVHPADLAPSVETLRTHPSKVNAAELRALVPELARLAPGDVRVGLLQRLLAQMHSVQNAAAWLIEHGPAWDCMLVFNEAIDVFGHHFMAYHPPKMASVNDKDFDRFKGVVDGVYEMQDRMLGRLLQLAGPETTVVLVSDHGFHSDHLRPTVPPAADDKHAAMDATWHREHGVVVLSGPGFTRGTPDNPKEVQGSTLLDITPTVLALLGLPMGADMDGRVLVEALDRPVEVERVPSWDEIEGESGMHPADLRVDTIESAQAVKQLIELGYLADMSGDEQAMLDNIDRESRFNLSMAKLGRGDFLGAAELLAALVESKPGEARYALSLAQCWLNAGDAAKARAAIETFLVHCPGHADAGMALAGALIAEGRPAQAATMLEKETAAHAAAGGPSVPERDCLLGTAYIEMRDAAKAESAFRRAAAADPHNARAKLGLAQSDLIRERYESAAEHAFEAVQLQHFLPDAHYTLGVALARHGVTLSGDERKETLGHAVQFLGIAVSMQPGYLDAHRYLASVHGLLGDAASSAKHKGIAVELLGRIGRVDRFVDPMSEPPLGPRRGA